MSLRGQSNTRAKAQYFIYLQNLPDHYVRSPIFPDVFLHAQMREGLVQLQAHRDQAYCLFGFSSKLLSNKFEKEMQKYMPHFVLISRRYSEVTPELKAEKQYYDNRTLSTTVEEELPEIKPRKEATGETDIFSKKTLQGSLLGGGLLDPIWRRFNLRQ